MLSHESIKKVRRLKEQTGERFGEIPSWDIERLELSRLRLDKQADDNMMARVKKSKETGEPLLPADIDRLIHLAQPAIKHYQEQINQLEKEVNSGEPTAPKPVEVQRDEEDWEILGDPPEDSDEFYH